MKIGKYYVSLHTGRVFLVRERDDCVVTYWNCVTKQEDWGLLPEKYREITREQAFDPAFQKWAKACWGEKDEDV